LRRCDDRCFCFPDDINAVVITHGGAMRVRVCAENRSC
jgi:hypothetical protein